MGMPTAEVARLRAARRRALARLPNLEILLRGTLVSRMTLCSTPGCKCHRGEKHGPCYWVGVSYPKRKTRQVYIPKRFKESAEAGIDSYRRLWNTIEEISRINLELLHLREPLVSTE